MIQTIKTPRFLVLSLLILAAAATRALPLLVPHVWNFTAVGALAIFAGAQFSDKRLAFIMPLAAMAISDVFIGNGFSAIVYAGFVAMVACGFFLINQFRIFLSKHTLSAQCRRHIGFLRSRITFL